MPEITTYDPSLCTTAGQIRKMGFPIPEGIPDNAWVLNKTIKTWEFSNPKRGETAHSVVFEMAPFRLGLTRYVVQGDKIVIEIVKETKDEDRRPPECSRPGETHPVF